MAVCLLVLVSGAPFNAVEKPWFYNGDVNRKPYFALEVSKFYLKRHEKIYLVFRNNFHWDLSILDRYKSFWVAFMIYYLKLEKKIALSSWLINF